MTLLLVTVKTKAAFVLSPVEPVTKTEHTQKQNKTIVNKMSENIHSGVDYEILVIYLHLVFAAYSWVSSDITTSQTLRFNIGGGWSNNKVIQKIFGVIY